MASGSESLPLGENNAKRYDDRKVNRGRDKKEQEDIEEEIYPLPARRLPRRRVEQYFGLSHLHDGLRLGEASRSESAYRARFTTIVKKNMGYNVQAYGVSLGHWVEVEIGCVGHNSGF